MQLRAALVCDHAEIREGLLFVVAAGVTRVARPQFPAQAVIFVAFMFEISPEDRPLPQEIEVHVDGPDGRQIAQMTGALQVPPNVAFEAGESTLAPFILDLRQAALPVAGWYTVRVLINGNPETPLRFKAVQGQLAQPAPAPIPAPVSRRRH